MVFDGVKISHLTRSGFRDTSLKALLNAKKNGINTKLAPMTTEELRIDEQVKILDRIDCEEGRQIRVRFICAGFDMLTTNSLSWEHLARFRNIQFAISIGLPGFRNFLYPDSRCVSHFEVFLPRVFTARSLYAAWGHFDVRGLCLLQLLLSQAQILLFTCTTTTHTMMNELDRHTLFASAISEIHDQKLDRHHTPPSVISKRSGKAGENELNIGFNGKRFAIADIWELEVKITDELHCKICQAKTSMRWLRDDHEFICDQHDRYGHQNIFEPTTPEFLNLELPWHDLNDARVYEELYPIHYQHRPTRPQELRRPASVTSQQV